MDEKVLDVLSEIQSELQKLESDLGEMRSQLDRIKDGQERIERDVVLLKTEGKDIKDELVGFSERVEGYYQTLRSRVGDVLESVQVLDRRKLDKDALKKLI